VGGGVGGVGGGGGMGEKMGGLEILATAKRGGPGARFSKLPITFRAR